MPSCVDVVNRSSPSCPALTASPVNPAAAPIIGTVSPLVRLAPVLEMLFPVLPRSFDTFFHFGRKIRRVSSDLDHQRTNNIAQPPSPHSFSALFIASAIRFAVSSLHSSAAGRKKGCGATSEFVLCPIKYSRWPNSNGTPCIAFLLNPTLATILNSPLLFLLGFVTFSVLASSPVLLFIFDAALFLTIVAASIVASRSPFPPRYARHRVRKNALISSSSPSIS